MAPYDVHLITVNTKDEEANALTERLEAALMAEGYDVLTDDRNERVGSKFSDSDLIGLPIRVTVGKKAHSFHTVHSLYRSLLYHIYHTCHNRHSHSNSYIFS